MKKKRFIAIILIFSMMVFLGACGDPYKNVPLADPEKAGMLMRDGGFIQMAHKAKDNTLVLNTNLLINEQNVGKLKESGFWDFKVTYSNDGNKMFYVTDKNTEESKELEKRYAEYDTSTTYIYYDMDGNCKGYAQRWYMPFGENIRHDVWVFLDKNGENKGYYIDSNVWDSDWVNEGATIYTMEGEKVGSIDFSKDFWSSYCCVDINLGEAKEALSAGDRVAICICCARQIYDHYFDYSD